MKRVLIFIGLKIAEVVGGGAILFGLVWCIVQVHNWVGDFMQAIAPYLVCGLLGCMVIAVLISWVKLNWEWSGEIANKGK